MGNGEPADLVLSASWIVPVEPAGCILEDHALAVRDGSIAALGPVDGVDARFSPRGRVHLEGHALVPGFVNAHTHAAMTLFRVSPTISRSTPGSRSMSGPPRRSSWTKGSSGPGHASPRSRC